RGRAFSIYDVLFNTAECLAAGAAVLVLPDVGWSRPVQALLVVFVWAVALWYLRGVRRLGDRPVPVAPSEPGLDARTAAGSAQPERGVSAC
ncbi:MAG: hypothetical protein Q4A20_15045, partial [Actinomyces sp.]|nr:hypothetical protein [Actinomyces sp.]